MTQNVGANFHLTKEFPVEQRETWNGLSTRKKIISPGKILHGAEG